MCLCMCMFMCVCMCVCVCVCMHIPVLGSLFTGVSPVVGRRLGRGGRSNGGGSLGLLVLFELVHNVLELLDEGFLLLQLLGELALLLHALLRGLHRALDEARCEHFGVSTETFFTHKTDLL